jgi:hypothetical protein
MKKSAKWCASRPPNPFGSSPNGPPKRKCMVGTLLENRCGGKELGD